MISILYNGSEMSDDTCVLVDKNTGELTIYSSDIEDDTNEKKIRELNSINSDTKVSIEIYDNSTVTEFEKSYRKKYRDLYDEHEALKQSYIALCKQYISKEV